MIDSLLHARPSRLSFVLLAAVSGLATALILADAFGASPVQQAVLAAARTRALASRRAVVLAEAALRTTATTPAPAVSVDTGSGGGGGGGGAGGGGGTPTPSPAAPAPADSGTPTPAPSTGNANSPAPAPAATTKATVSHLFEIVLSSTGYDATFGPHSTMPYLRSLAAHGAELSQYHSLGRGPLADELALVSGQPPNADTSAGCTTYAEFPTATAPNATGVVNADGCVYPETVITLGDQISSAGHLWRAYVDGMGSQACVHPNSNATDNAVLTGADPTYDTRQNPFIYFHSLLDLGDCATSDLDLGKLSGALAQRAHAPAYVFVAPGECEDATPLAVSPPAGTTTTASTTSSASTATQAPSETAAPAASDAATTSSTPSASGPPATATSPGCPAGQPSGPAAQDAFLKAWVPKILASSAYRDKGALVIAFTAVSPATHPVRTGALVLTPHGARHHTVATAADPYTLLRGTESALGLTPLAEAKDAKDALASVF